MRTDCEKQCVANRPAALQRLFQFMAIPSVSTDAGHTADCVKAAQWLTRELQGIGFEAKSIETQRHQAVVAHGPRLRGAPHVLFYGHYDVQPASLEDGWENQPFEPAVVQRDGRSVIHGRGAADDKGLVMTFVEACRVLLATGGLPVNVTLLIEGEEEIGSPSLEHILQTYGEELQADIALICDTAMLDRDTPAIGCQLRGFVGEIISIQAADQDLHSGNYGGAAHNPAQIMSEALASIRDASGGINLAGFYDGVPELSETLRNDWDGLGHIGQELLEEAGLSDPAGEQNRSVLEQLWSRPCFDINSLWSGYLGEGFKTILPATAHAKISFRLVGHQNPENIRNAFRAAVRKKIPTDCQVSFEAYGSVAATQLDATRPEIAVAKQATQDLWAKPCVLVGMGSSIPAVGALKSTLGMDSLLLGFGQADDQIHGPNEKLDLESFEKGTLAWVRLLQGLGVANHQEDDRADESSAVQQKDYLTA